jgi:hypothetical protein
VYRAIFRLSEYTWCSTYIESYDRSVNVAMPSTAGFIEMLLVFLGVARSLLQREQLTFLVFIMYELILGDSSVRECD